MRIWRGGSHINAAVVTQIRLNKEAYYMAAVYVCSGFQFSVVI